MEQLNFQDPKSHPSRNYYWKNVKILIAEDEEINFLFLEEILSSTGLRIIRASDGNEAIEKCLVDPDIRLVLMDIKMPDLDGFDATRRIREFRQDLPIIAQTAYAFPEDQEKSLRAGCTNYISKPINRDYLLHLLNHYLPKNA